MRALVTGDAGFLGRHFRRALEARGATILGLDIARDPRSDCRALFATDRMRFDLVIHAAAVIGGRARIDGDPLALAENLELDAAMFRWAARTRPGRVVYLSSSAVYPVALQEPLVGGGGIRLREHDVRPGWAGPPDQVYGWSKLVGEVLAGKAREVGVPVTVMRPFSGYGADQDTSYPFGAFLERVRRRADPFEVWGDGTQTRDFVHVDDVVAATLAAVDAGLDGPLNICTGRPTSFDQLAAMVCRAARYTPRRRYVLGAPTGVAYRVGDPTRLHAIYRPKVTLEEGIGRALDEPGAAPVAADRKRFEEPCEANR